MASWWMAGVVANGWCVWHPEASQSYPLAVLGGLGRLHEGWLLFFRFEDTEERQLEASGKRPGGTSGRRKNGFCRGAVAIFAMSPGAPAST